MTSALSTGTVITVAPTGGHAKADVPHLPLTSEEVAVAASDCERIGASAVDLQPRHDTAASEVVAAVRARTKSLIRLATYARSETLGELLEAGADVLVCPLDAPQEFVADLTEQAPHHGATVHYEARSLPEIAALPARAEHVLLVFEDGRMPWDVSTFAAALARLPAGTTFSATGVGTAAMPVMLATLAAGGHVRVGMADTLDYAPDTPVRDNAQLVARAAGLAKIAQRPALDPENSAKIFGLAK